MPVLIPDASAQLCDVHGAPQRWLSWAVFVAMSWTWCIGMFLPVLLVRDFGLLGWILFAVPNVVGAAAMGTVLRSARQSVDLVFGHAFACAAFSAITIIFHVFFVGWVVRGLLGPITILIAVPLAIIFALLSRSDHAAMALCWFVLAASIAGFVAASFSSVEHVSRHLLYPSAHPMRVMGLAAVCFVGFALNPYLDLTFHRARQALQPAPGRRAFAVGFLLPFLLMISFTLWYARVLLPGRWDLLPDRLRWIIGGHLLLQAALTVGLHASSLASAARADRQARRGADIFGLIGLALLIGWGAGRMPTTLRVATDEVPYWLFMGFYGAVFPAYVWLCVLPDRRGSTQRTRAKLIATGIVIAIVFPMLWKAFIGGAMSWAVPAMTILVLSRWTIPTAGKSRG